MLTLKRLYARFLPKILLHHYRAKQPTDHLMASLDHDALTGLLKYKEQTGHPQYRKYFNAQYWLRKNLTRVLSLKLDRQKPLKIMDIGCGFGYFPYAAKFYGHDVLGVDLPGDTLFQKASAFLGIERKEHRINPMEVLPNFGSKFDLITAFQVCFNGHQENELWGRKEWGFFLEDLFANHITENGKLYMELNWSPHIKAWLPEDVIELFTQKYNAKFEGAYRVFLYAPQGQKA